MELTYDAQLAAKRGYVVEAFKKHGMDVAPAPVVAAPAEDGYRRRTTARGSFGPSGVQLGLLRAGTRELIDLPECMVLHPQLRLALGAVREAVAAYAGDASGAFQVEAVGDTESRVGLVFTVAPDLVEMFEEVCLALVEAGVECVSLFDEAGTRLLEEGDPRQFKIGSQTRFSVRSFTQLNFEQNISLVAHVVQVARDAKAKRVLDLYSGIGNYALELAREAEEVVAVESAMSSVADCRDNAAARGLANLKSLRSPSGEAVRELVRRRERFDLVVLNPTRAGADGVVEPLVKLKAPRIAYVSCSPPTLARDVAGLVRGGYRLASLTPFDMFPQTYHVETVAVLTRDIRC